MRSWTDEELGSLLTETMRSREGLVRDEDARRIVRETLPARPRWPRELIAVAAVLLVVAGGLYVALQAKSGAGQPTAVGQPGTDPTSLTTSPAVPTATTLPTSGQSDPTAQDYYDLAAAASDSTLASFTPPPHSTKIDGPPKGWHGDVSAPTSDTTLSRTGWWKTSLSESEVSQYLDQGSPSTITTKELSTGSGTGPDYVFSNALFEEPGDPVYMAYSAPLLGVAYETIGDFTYLKVVSFETARYPVPTRYRIAEPITSVQVATLSASQQMSGVEEPTTVTYSGSSDDAAITRLVKAYNAMPADFTIPMTFFCPAQTLPRPTTTVTFTGSSGHVWTAMTTPYRCGLGFQVSYGHETFGPVLDGSTLLDALS